MLELNSEVERSCNSGESPTFGRHVRCENTAAGAVRVAAAARTTRRRWLRPPAPLTPLRAVARPTAADPAARCNVYEAARSRPPIGRLLHILYYMCIVY